MKLLKGLFLLAFVAVLSISCKETKKETNAKITKTCNKDYKKSCCVVAEKKCYTSKKLKNSYSDKDSPKCLKKKIACKTKCEVKMTQTKNDGTCCKSKK